MVDCWNMTCMSCVLASVDGSCNSDSTFGNGIIIVVDDALDVSGHQSPVASGKAQSGTDAALKIVSGDGAAVMGVNINIGASMGSLE